ncbi:hypothetical protein IG605_010430 [Pectobacterium quasiaquaticum]|uniref:hypothetical protein n=1 Tax=Pectobacterium TaxID=122277 RepID=UPI001875BFCB|nr:MULTISPECIES: hypothetical protein [Pectobacterium]MBE5215999.1 hypothetical protein [Pectobacterium quasiaquaticum]MBE5227560.1 hypothetical protein [Pectobacterium quasiaquaticum]MBN3066331.1 hypothetical protein [Pectobacterium aquaticum]URG51157.1 hypothetical protein IG605_010430 [Pectobacterium quasiaquaticum]
MRKIKLMADYQCHPLWDVSPENYGDISPEELLISSELKNSLEEWAKRYDAILNMDDPASSGFNSESEENLFIDDGYKLAQLLREELGNEYEIIYQP